VRHCAQEIIVKPDITISGGLLWSQADRYYENHVFLPSLLKSWHNKNESSEYTQSTIIESASYLIHIFDIY
jgi:hypothetical protein